MLLFLYMPRRKSQRGARRPLLLLKPQPIGYPGMQNGQGWLGDAWRWVKRNKVVSTAANVAGTLGVPGASTVGKIAGAVGLGRGRSAPRAARTGIHGVTQW